jgi:hypothetical protein
MEQLLVFNEYYMTAFLKGPQIGPTTPKTFHSPIIKGQKSNRKDAALIHGQLVASSLGRHRHSIL